MLRTTVHLLVPLAAWAAIRSLSAGQTDPTAGAEGPFLAGLAAAVLVCVAGLGEEASRALLAAGLLVPLAAWALPAGPARGAVVVLLLVAVLALAAASRGRALRGRDGLPLGLVLPLALGIQVLVGTHRLVGESLSAELIIGQILGLLGPPVLAALALYFLGRHHPPARVALAGGLAAALGPGWTLGGTLALAGLAAAESLLRAWKGHLLEPDQLRARLLGDGRLGEAVGAVPLALPLACGLAGIGADGILPGWAAALAVALATLWLPARGASASVEGAAAFGLGTLALALGAYPWLRPEPLAAALDLVGPAAGWPAALVLGSSIFGLGLLLGRLEVPVPWPAAAGAGLLLAAVASGLGPADRPLIEGGAVTLTVRNPQWALDLPDEPDGGTLAAGLVLDTNLAHGAELAAGTALASVRLLHPDGGESRWTLEAGRDTGEWAARRPDVAATPGLAVPAPWLSGVAPEGGFLAQRYRGRWRLPAPRPVERLEGLRDPHLPRPGTLALFQLTLEPAAPAAGAGE